MRLIGGITEVANETISSRLLINLGVNDPDYVPTMFSPFKDEESDIMSILDMKGLKTSGINNATNNNKYRTVGSNHVTYRIEFSDMRKQYFKANSAGVTFKDDANPTEPGKHGLAFKIYSNSNWTGFKEIMELGDNKTFLYNLADPKEKDGVFEYTVKLLTNDSNEYCDPWLLQDGAEFAPVSNAHEHDFSERGSERYTNGGWGHTFLSLLRFSYSWSGTAGAMKTSGRWVESYGEKAFLPQAHEKMMRKAAKQLDWALVWGKQTVTEDFNKVFLTDLEGREIMTGSGIMNQGDGAIAIPQNQGWTKKWLEAFMSNIDSYITRGDDGQREMILRLAPKSYLSFNQLMTTMGVTQNSNIVGEGADKGIIDTYKFYELAGLRVIANRASAFANAARPGIPLPDGTRTNDWDGFCIPIGNTASGARGIELVQLRPMAGGTVAGIDQSGNITNTISSSVDGSSRHVLFQIGVISQVQPISIYRPFVKS